MELWPSDGSVKDGQLLPQGRVLEGNRRRPVNKGASKGPETDREEHRHSLAGDCELRVYPVSEGWRGSKFQSG